MSKEKLNFKEIILFLKETGFIYPGSEIYGGLANSWDYGPLGTKLKNNIKKFWNDFFVKNSSYLLPIETSILLNSKVWVASGHLANFNDPLVDCLVCKSRFRADWLIEQTHPELHLDNLPLVEYDNLIKKYEIKCLKCQQQQFTKTRQFQLMFATSQGSLLENYTKLYLRPETAQGMFINFNNIKNTYNKKLPFGLAQIGKSFRNEITPGNFIFRTLEFEQMEIEFFYAPSDKKDWYQYWVKESEKFLIAIGLKKNNFYQKNHDQDKLSHYSRATCDINYCFPFGDKELLGIADRGDYDLKQHNKFSNELLTITDLTTQKAIIPYVIEPSFGVERLLLAVICDAYTKEQLKDKTRIVLKLNPNLVPFHVAVSSLNKNKLGTIAQEVFKTLKTTNLDVTYEEKSSIGKVYNYHDSIGTLFCVTIDFETVNDQTVTVRNRDTLQQERVKIADLSFFLYQKLNWLPK